MIEDSLIGITKYLDQVATGILNPGDSRYPASLPVPDVILKYVLEQQRKNEVLCELKLKELLPDKEKRRAQKYCSESHIFFTCLVVVI